MAYSKRIIVFAFVFFSLGLAVSCKKKNQESKEQPTYESVADPIEFQDVRGKTVELNDSAIKIVSLLPSITEYIYELDRGHLLVGRSTWCKNPDEALEIEMVGDLNDTDDERLKALKPDVVLVSKMMEKDQVEHLEAMGNTVVVFDHQNWETLQRDLEILGKIIGAEGDVKTLISLLSLKRKIVRDEIHALENYTPLPTAILYSLNPLHSAGPGSFVDELLSIAGGTNVAADHTSLWPTLTLNDLVQKQPQIILISSEPDKEEELKADIQSLAKEAVWAQIPAIRNNRVYLLDSQSLTVPGPRHVLALSQMAAALHPDLFEKPNQLKQVNMLQAPRRP